MAEEMPTTMYLQRPTKDRFDTLKREIEAERDENLTNAAVLDMLLDEWEGSHVTADPDPRIDPPTACEECGATLGARFTVKDGEALCLSCGGVEPADGGDR